MHKKKNAIITGAGSGIGRQLAIRFARSGVDLCLVGRTPRKLESLRDELVPFKSTVHIFPCNLDQDDDLSTLPAKIEGICTTVDFLIHCAGIISLAPLASVPISDMDAHYRINVRGPLAITQSLLPLIGSARGQIVFVNSSLGVRTKENAGAYAASKHALKALADTLRMEINETGVRVLSVFPGNTATPMQEQVCRELQQTYRPDEMLQPEDVATAIIDALSLPSTAELTDLHIRPARKPLL